MRMIALLIVAILSIAATLPPPPQLLQPYIKDNRFDPGDYSWMRGRFEDATAAEKADSATINQWTKACFEAGQAETRAKLRAMGVPDPQLKGGTFADSLCAEVAHAPFRLTARTFPDFHRALAEAEPVADTYLLAVDLAERKARPRAPDLADALLARPLAEQMLRTAMNWGEGELKEAPALSADAKAILDSRLGTALQRRDRENTEWLKSIVTKGGWPKISEVGEPASQAAWLLVQHADADPAFQLQALRLMEPLIASDDVSKQNYAYLYDRVMLKLAGKQRYATQGMCRGGKHVPQPLEDEPAVDRLRSAMGLNPLRDYMAQLEKFAGACPPGPEGPVPGAR